MPKNIGVDAAKLAGLQIDMLQKLRNGQMTIEQMEWFSGLTADDRDWLLGNRDSRFKQIGFFNFFVPEDFAHKTCLGAFKKNHQEKFAFPREDGVLFEDKRFARVTDELASGQRIGVCVFEARVNVGFEDCLNFVRRRSDLLVGAQGLVVAIEQAWSYFPRGQDCFSLDMKNVLWKNSLNNHLVWSSALHTRFDHFVFELRPFDWDLRKCECLLLFRNLSPKVEVETVE